ncbi:hypothetical protein NEOLEDRAFT_1071242, partial [Neolentinus lepideus HHB14362 ss-1]
TTVVPFGVTYEKIGTIQRRLAWPLHKDDTLTQSGSSTELNIYALFYIYNSHIQSRLWFEGQMLRLVTKTGP